MFFLSFQSNQKSFIQRCKICHFLVAILFTMMPCIILLEISCEDELPIFKRSLLNFSTRYDASSIVKQKGTVFQWHLPKWSMIESRNICIMYVFLVWISRSYFYLASFSKNKNNLRKYTYPALWFVVWYPIQDVV